MTKTAQKELNTIRELANNIQEIIISIEANSVRLKSKNTKARLDVFSKYTELQDELETQKIRINKAIDKYLINEFKRSR